MKGDGKRLERDYGVETHGMVDLRTYARACWVDLPCRSLAGMTATALGRSLSKDPAVRFSCWSKPELTMVQVFSGCTRDFTALKECGTLLYCNKFFESMRVFVVYFPSASQLCHLHLKVDARLLPRLRITQINYACLDAYAAVLVHAEIGKFTDPIFGEAPREAPPAGTKVDMTAVNWPFLFFFFHTAIHTLLYLFLSNVLKR